MDEKVKKTPIKEESRVTKFNITVRVEADEGGKTLVVPMEDGTELSLSSANALLIYEAVRKEALIADMEFVLENKFKNDDGTYNLGDNYEATSIPKENRGNLIADAVSNYIAELDASEEKWFEARTQDYLRSVYDDFSEE